MGILASGMIDLLKLLGASRNGRHGEGPAHRRRAPGRDSELSSAPGEIHDQASGGVGGDSFSAVQGGLVIGAPKSPAGRLVL